ncbi:hypothetical protein [Rhizosphaericola mali]|uniref:Uncharacterized protein n=1 Tax=Rhizosphaericola mali TaxID=2545455 RepID=A0A5P2G807_9BACT|nr:hypothetical protein [Rhizosphaericola mali]QES90828.1 hypothetical protein E0W69_019985 [Rhizosphaericola mali]
MSAFALLFGFQSGQFSVVEIKRLDINSDRKEDIYYWIQIKNSNGNYALKRLSFVSMSQNEKEQFRQFQKGRLHFNNTTAIFENEEGKFELQKMENLPPDLDKIIGQFLIA